MQITKSLGDFWASTLRKCFVVLGLALDLGGAYQAIVDRGVHLPTLNGDPIPSEWWFIAGNLLLLVAAFHAFHETAVVVRAKPIRPEGFGDTLAEFDEAIRVLSDFVAKSWPIHAKQAGLAAQPWEVVGQEARFPNAGHRDSRLLGFARAVYVQDGSGQPRNDTADLYERSELSQRVSTLGEFADFRAAPRTITKALHGWWDDSHMTPRMLTNITEILASRESTRRTVKFSMYLELALSECLGNQRSVDADDPWLEWVRSWED